MPRGAKPGERRGGRKAGTPNKANAPLKAYAQQYDQECIDFAVDMMRNGEAPPQARVAAANLILDRGHGKPPQALTGADDTPLIPPKTIYELHLPQ